MPPRSKSPPRTRSKTGKTRKKQRSGRRSPPISWPHQFRRQRRRRPSSARALGLSPGRQSSSARAWLQTIEEEAKVGCRRARPLLLRCIRPRARAASISMCSRSCSPATGSARMIDGTLFGCLLALQGALSYANDGLVTLGRPRAESHVLGDLRPPVRVDADAQRRLAAFVPSAGGRATRATT